MKSKIKIELDLWKSLAQCRKRLSEALLQRDDHAIRSETQREQDILEGFGVAGISPDQPEVKP